MKTSSWIAVIAIVLGVGYIVVGTLRMDGTGSRGVPAGEVLPPFALPTVDHPDDELPANTLVSARDGAPKACDVRVANSFTSCALTARRPAVIAFLVTVSERCTAEIDRLERLRARFEDIEFAVVAIRGKRADLRRTVRERGWTMRVGHDTDGRVANAYGIAVCPTVTLAERGGRVAGTVLGEASTAELERRIAKLRG